PGALPIWMRSLGQPASPGCLRALAREPRHSYLPTYTPSPSRLAGGPEAGATGGGPARVGELFSSGTARAARYRHVLTSNGSPAGPGAARRSAHFLRRRGPNGSGAGSGSGARGPAPLSRAPASFRFGGTLVALPGPEP